MNKIFKTYFKINILIISIFVSTVFLLLANTIYCQFNKDNLIIWLAEPAKTWEHAFPIGNGRLGAMIFGKPFEERIQLNEESVWAGRQIDFHNPLSKEGLKEVRKLLFANKFAEAEKIALKKIMGKRPENEIHSYQTLGDLYINFERPRYANIKNYKRILDIENAIAKVEYELNGIHFKREIFSSAIDQVIVIRLTNDEKMPFTCSLYLSRPGDKAIVKTNGNEITMEEHVNNGVGVYLFTLLKVFTCGGEIKNQDQTIVVEKSPEIIIFLTAATDYSSKNPKIVCYDWMNKATNKNYDKIKSEHINDYKKYFNRLSFSLGSNNSVLFPTDSRLEALKNGNYDPQLFVLYYQFARYLLISSSRPGCMPANLQGIWADGLIPPWNADYHININIQMNYWLAEPTNLSELHIPFLEFIKSLVPDARKTAKEVYGCRGIVAHFTTDAWHYTEPYGRIHWGMWPMGLNWCCQHLWEHFAFSCDTSWLDTFAYPILREASLFCIDWLVKDPRTGYLVSGPSISPENSFITPDGYKASLVMGPTMDHMIIRELLQNTIKASEILKIDSDLREKLIKIEKQLTTIKLTKNGRIMEWSEEFNEYEPGHRHISHLYGLHPGNQITSEKPELMEAAKKTIEYRLQNGGGHTGWSRAWIINFYARLFDGEKAFENLKALLTQSTLPNLLDTHPPFQIDGNFGGTAGITEMLLQSHTGEINVLPALPQEWSNGYIYGLKARGGFEIDIDWENHELKKLVVKSFCGNNCKLRYKNKIIDFSTEKNKTYVFDNNLNQI